MHSEPGYLASLGEFATLKNTIGSWYHQDAYLDFGTDDDIWRSIWAGHDAAYQGRLVGQLTRLLCRNDTEILGMWNSEAQSHSYTDAKEAREFLGSMLSFFREQS